MRQNFGVSLRCVKKPANSFECILYDNFLLSKNSKNRFDSYLVIVWIYWPFSSHRHGLNSCVNKITSLGCLTIWPIARAYFVQWTKIAYEICLKRWRFFWEPTVCWNTRIFFLPTWSRWRHKNDLFILYYNYDMNGSENTPRLHNCLKKKWRAKFYLHF